VPLRLKWLFKKLQVYKSLSIDHIHAELIKEGNKTSLINYLRNQDVLLEDLKELIIVHIPEKGDKTECSYHRGISHLSIKYKFYSTL
jgi:hypothetical protein